MQDRPWLQHYDPGVPHHIEVPPIPLHAFLQQAAQRFPDRPCAIFKGHAVTYREMDALTDHLAAALVAMGVRAGQPVGIFMPNTAQFVMAFYAILKAGGIVVATTPLYTARKAEDPKKD